MTELHTSKSRRYQFSSLLFFAIFSVAQLLESLLNNAREPGSFQTRGAGCAEFACSVFDIRVLWFLPHSKDMRVGRANGHYKLSLVCKWGIESEEELMKMWGE